MKKIKFLLLWIVSILWISFSSAEITYIWWWTLSNWFTFDSWITDFSWDSVYSPDCYVFDQAFLNESIFFNSLVYSAQIFACWDISVNNTSSSSISLTPYIYYYNSVGWSSSVFPYYSNWLVSRIDPDLTSTFVLPRRSEWDYYFWENTCVYIYYYDNRSSNIKLCDLEDYDNCYSSYNIQNTLICWDWFHYNSNNVRFDSHLDYYVFKFDSWGWNESWQDFESPVDWGIFDFNTFLIEKSILCYMSSWTFWGNYWNCDWFNYTWFVDQYEHVSPIWSWDSESGYVWNIVFNNAQPVLSNYCINTDSIQYQFCSQLDVYSGAYLMYYYEDWLLSYYVLWDWFWVDLGNLWSWQLWDLICQGAWCNNISQWLPEYIIPTDTWENNFGLSWDIISEDFYNDFIDKWFWFRCPYSYSWSYFVLWKDLINRLWGRDLMIPVNCFISAYSQWRNMLFFWDPEYWKYWSWSLINWNTPWHQRLFLFFDLVLSLWIIVVLSKLFKLLTTKK